MRDEGENLRRVGRDEMNLAEYPITLLTERVPPGCKTLVFEDRHGTLTVIGSDAYGLPTTTDSDVIVALIQLTKLRNDFTDPAVTFTRYELLKLLGWENKGRNYRRLSESLHRWVTVTLKYDGCWWDNKRKRRASASFHILDEVVLPDADDPGIESSFTWGKKFFKSCRDGNLKRLDVSTYFALKSAISKQLYRHLDKRFYIRPDWTFDLPELAHEHVGMSRSYAVRNIKQKLRPALEELEEIGFLEPMSPADRYSKTGRGQWNIRLVRKLPTPAETKPKPEPEPTGLERELVERGVTRSVAADLVRDFPADRIRRQVEVVDWLRETKPKRVADVGAYLAEAIRKDFAAPAGFQSRAERAEAEATARAQREREEQTRQAKARARGRGADRRLLEGADARRAAAARGRGAGRRRGRRPRGVRGGAGGRPAAAAGRPPRRPDPAPARPARGGLRKAPGRPATTSRRPRTTIPPSPGPGGPPRAAWRRSRGRPPTPRNGTPRARTIRAGAGAGAGTRPLDDTHSRWGKHRRPRSPCGRRLTMSLIPPPMRARTDDQGDRGDFRAASLRQIHQEIVEGNLRNERARLDDALYNLEFYRGDFSRFPVRPSGQQQDPTRYPRYTPLLQRVVCTLCQHLYARGPARQLKAPAGMPAGPYDAASRWLEGVYRRNCADAIWQEADRLSAVSSVAAIQVSAGPDPARPIRLRLWDASQFVVWEDPDEPTKPVAVGTIDLFDHRRRLTLYTPDVKRTYVTQKLGPNDSAGGTAYSQTGESRNPYGIIPFEFAWFHMPVGSDFWCGSPGSLLRHVNDGLNFGLTEGFDCIRYNLRPVILLKNVRGGFRPPSPIRPGDVWSLPEMADATGEGGRGADAAYLQADSSFVAASWEDFRSYVDMVMEHTGVPPGTIRMEQTSVASGVRVIADHIPLIQWAESRQRPFTHYEDELAKLVLTIGAVHLGAQSDRDALATADPLGQVAADPGLVLRWADMYPYLPGPDRNADDGWLLENHLTSRTMVLMKREKLTRAEASQRLDEIAGDERHERAVLGLDADGRPRAEPGPGTGGRGQGARTADGGGSVSVKPPLEVGGPDDDDDDGDDEW